MMTKFYVAYVRDGQPFLAVVRAPARPASLQFASYEELCQSMDALGNPWELLCPMPDPREYAVDATQDWLEKLSEAAALDREPKPQTYLWGVYSLWGIS